MAAPYPTREDFFNVGARELLARQVGRPPGKRVTEKAVYTTGTNVNAALAAGAAMADEVMRHTAIRFSELFLDSSDDEALSRLVADHIDAELSPKQPARSIVSVQCRRQAAGVAYTVQNGSVLRIEGGTEFRLTEDAVFSAAALATGLATAEAQVAGTVGNVEAGTITQFAQRPTDLTITVTNPEFASGGADLETGRDFLARAKLTRKTRARGTLGALVRCALDVTGIKYAIAENLLDAEGDATGWVRMFVGDASGRANNALLERVRLALQDYACGGIRPFVASSVPTFNSIAYNFPVASGYDLVTIRSQLKTATAAIVNLLQPHETLRRAMLLALARTIPGYDVSESGLTTPAADVLATDGAIIRTRTDLITVNGV